MRMYDLIEKKKQGEVLNEQEIDFIVTGYTNGSIPDYQMSALLMAIYFKGMNEHETAQFTLAMANSGQTLDLSEIKGVKVDKHSTGGVGDTTTLVLAPLVAAAGVPVAKMSGRGLGHTGGTVDKLESFDGFVVELQQDQFIDNVNTHGIAVVGQTGNLAPADKKIYALRDVTATVDNVSLIAASIMSKKIAAGADAIVLDVKCGSGAFMKTLEDAKHLAKTMVGIGNNVGRKTIALVTDMNQPLSQAIGNSLEVIEAIEILKGRGPKELMEVSETLASNMLMLANKVESEEEGKALVRELISSGRAIEKMKEWIASQGGNKEAIENYALLPQAANTCEVVSDKVGYIQAIDTEMIGKAALVLGAGRENKETQIDLGVGLMLRKRIGDAVAIDEALVTLHYNASNKVEDAKEYIRRAYTISETPVEAPPLIYTIIRE